MTRPVRARDHFLAADYRLAQGFTERPVKITMPGPMTIADTPVDLHYDDPARLGADLAAALNAEVLSLAPAGSPAEERARLDAAIAGAAADIQDLVAASDEMGAEILEFQLALIEDPELVAPALDGIAAGQAGGLAWREALDAQIAGYAAAEDGCAHPPSSV